jgi:type IV pilus assembly protein PilP
MKGMLMIAMQIVVVSWLAPSAMAADAKAPATSEAVTMHRVKAPELDIAKLRDPFESYLTVLERKSKQRREASRSRDADRVSEPLEDFDLGALKLVAIMQMGNKRAAMVENHEGKGFVVREGSYIGRDNGRVVNITERNVEIMEDEFNVVGEVVQRKAVLTLDEVNQ